LPLQQTVDFDGNTTQPDEHVLARIGFDKAHAIGADPRDVTIALPSFASSKAIECWRSERPVETGRHKEIAYASDGRFVFGHLLIDEVAGSSLEMPAYHGYVAMLNSLKAFGGLHLLRVWNYVGKINEDQAGMERYRAFCVGRSRALADQGLRDETLPAASGVGASAPGLMISFIAATDPGAQIENPRQVSAFRYPERYGPKSPSFSRALTYQLTSDRALLFISGTASIVGHETLHQDDLTAQFEETCRNIDAVREATARQSKLETLRLYVRHERDAAASIAMMRQHFGDELPIIALKSNICRKDLLLEIEGVASLRPSRQSNV